MKTKRIILTPSERELILHSRLKANSEKKELQLKIKSFKLAHKLLTTKQGTSYSTFCSYFKNSDSLQVYEYIKIILKYLSL